ncbi:MAG: hypothetical protein ACI4MS_06940 [Candidatus Coproplasma sp.]
MILIFFAVTIFIRPDRYITACFNGICLWAECVLPSLFPFMVICALLSSLGAINFASRPLFRLSKKLKLPKLALPLFFMSAIAGYPAGSRLVASYYKDGYITRSEARKLAPLCSACGPLFALGTIGVKAFGGGYYGVKLLSASLISILSTSLIYCLFAKSQKAEDAPIIKSDRGNLLENAFYGGVTACLTAGAFICFFYTLSQIISDFNIFMPIEFILSAVIGDCAKGLCQGLCEATGGCFAVATSGGFFALPCAGFLCVFGGASILLQQLCYLTECGVKPSFFIAFKFVQGVVAFGILCLFLLF